MTTLPLMLAKTATSLIVSFAPTTSPIADFNDDGVVDTTDLVTLVGQLNQACDGCATDLNNDGMTDSTDILELMGQWGDVAGYVQPIEGNESVVADTDDQIEEVDVSWQGQGPVLFDAIYYDQLSRNAQHQELGLVLNQGEQAKAWAAGNNIATQPMAYHGGIDYNEDGEYSDDDKRRFRDWLDANVPQDYDGPLCLDMEGQWWSLFNTSNQTVMDVAIDFYIEGIEYAQAQRPNAKIGYWGLPKKAHTKETSTTADVSRLLKACTALFPDVYDHSPLGNGSSFRQYHIETAMEMVDGKVPVYVQASPRYPDTNNQYTQLHTVEEFMRDQIDSSLAAVYTDADGKEHRIAGVSLWDAYGYFWRYTENWTMLEADVQKSICDELDAYHVTLLAEMKLSVDVAYAASQERLDEATPASTQMVTSSNEEIATAKETAIASLKIQKQQEQSQLVRTIRSLNTSMVATTSSYKKSASSYRSARNNWSKARRTFSRTARKFGRNSSQYKKAYATYKTARNEMQSASKEYQEDRNEFKSARASMNQAKQQWKTANEGWSEMAAVEATLLASK